MWPKSETKQISSVDSTRTHNVSDRAIQLSKPPTPLPTNRGRAIENQSSRNCVSSHTELLTRNKKALVAVNHEGFCCMKPGETYFRTFGTIIGSESLTTVFEMGTGVTFLI